MKRRALEKHLRAHGCQLFREGSKHTVWLNPSNQRTTAVPRHREIKKFTAAGICKQLEIETP